MRSVTVGARTISTSAHSVSFASFNDKTWRIHLTSTPFQRHVSGLSHQIDGTPLRSRILVTYVTTSYDIFVRFFCLTFKLLFFFIFLLLSVLLNSFCSTTFHYFFPFHFVKSPKNNIIVMFRLLLWLACEVMRLAMVYGWLQLAFSRVHRCWCALRLHSVCITYYITRVFHIVVRIYSIHSFTVTLAHRVTAQTVDGRKWIKVAQSS